MKVRDFYTNLKDIIEEKVFIYNGIRLEQLGYLNKKQINEHLIEKEINEIYTRKNGLILGV